MVGRGNINNISYFPKYPARDGLNWFIYVNNNPLRFIDPSGMVGINDNFDEYLLGETLDEFEERIARYFLAKALDNAISDSLKQTIEDREFYNYLESNPELLEEFESRIDDLEAAGEDVSQIQNEMEKYLTTDSDDQNLKDSPELSEEVEDGDDESFNEKIERFREKTERFGERLEEARERQEERQAELERREAESISDTP